MRWRTFAFSLGCLVPLPTVAAEISVLSAGAVDVPLSSLAESYQRETGDKVEVKLNTMGGLRQKVAAGERAVQPVGLLRHAARMTVRLRANALIAPSAAQ